jgi:hypothetical protein
MRRERQSPLESLDRPPAPRFSRGSDALSGLIEHLAAALQEIALGRVLGVGDRRLIRLHGLGVAAETPQQAGRDLGAEAGTTLALTPYTNEFRRIDIRTAP